MCAKMLTFLLFDDNTNAQNTKYLHMMHEQYTKTSYKNVQCGGATIYLLVMISMEFFSLLILMQQILNTTQNPICKQ